MDQKLIPEPMRSKLVAFATIVNGENTAARAAAAVEAASDPEIMDLLRTSAPGGEYEDDLRSIVEAARLERVERARSTPPGE